MLNKENNYKLNMKMLKKKKKKKKKKKTFCFKQITSQS